MRFRTWPVAALGLGSLLLLIVLSMLTLSRIDDSGVVYDNDAWIPMQAVVAPKSTGVQVDGRDPQAAAARSEADGVAGVAAKAGTTSAIGPGTLLWSQAANPRWVATVNGRRVIRRDAFGWTNAFALDSHAPVETSARAEAGKESRRRIARRRRMVRASCSRRARRKSADSHPEMRLGLASGSAMDGFCHSRDRSQTASHTCGSGSSTSNGQRPKGGRRR